MVTSHEVPTRSHLYGRFRNRAITPGLLIALALTTLMAAQGDDGAVLNPVPIRVGEFRDGLAVVRDGKGFAYIDHAGRNVFGKQFMACVPFREGVAAVLVQGHGWQVINRQGEPVNRLPIMSIKDAVASEGLVAIAAMWDGRDMWGFIDVTGRMAINPLYKDVQGFSEGLAAVCLRGKWGYIDHAGTTCIAHDYDQARSFRTGIASVAVGDKWGCIDRKGQWTIEPDFDELRDCHEGLVAAKKRGKWGAVDRQGTVVIPTSYDDIGECSEGLIAVKSAKGWGFVNRKGAIIVQCGYHSAERFREGLAKVGIRSEEPAESFRYVYISKGGGQVGSSYRAAECFSEGLGGISSDSNAYFIDHDGKTIIDLPRGGLAVPKQLK